MGSGRLQFIKPQGLSPLVSCHRIDFIVLPNAALGGTILCIFSQWWALTNAANCSSLSWQPSFFLSGADVTAASCGHFQMRKCAAPTEPQPPPKQSSQPTRGSRFDD